MRPVYEILKFLKSVPPKLQHKLLLHQTWFWKLSKHVGRHSCGRLIQVTSSFGCKIMERGSFHLEINGALDADQLHRLLSWRFLLTPPMQGKGETLWWMGCWRKTLSKLRLFLRFVWLFWLQLICVVDIKIS